MRKNLFVVGIHFVVVFVVILSAGRAYTAADETEPLLSPTDVEPYIWGNPLPLPSKSCFASSSHDCLVSSPVLADIDGNGSLDIVVATNNGHIVVIKPDGQTLWNVDLSGHFGMGANQQEINSSPAVADIDNDGYSEIVIGVGTAHQEVCTQGGVIALSHTGQVEPGWPQHTEDWATPPAGCRDSIFGTPALGNMDDDPELEIAAGGFDMRLYAWNHDGTLLPGFPPDSWLRERYPWSVFLDHLGDTMWSSPTMADMDGDGYMDIVIGTDEGNQGDGWYCPYALPPGWRSGYCGGSLYIVNRFGQLTFGQPIHILEAIQSSPAVSDLDLDGFPDLIVGSGTFYRNQSPDHPTYGFQLNAWDRFGNELPGWGPDEPEGWGGNVNGPIPASPSLGDIAGDSKPEVIVAVAEERRLYAWHHDGRPVAGFPMTPVDLFGNSIASFDVGTGFVLADYDGDGKMEILFVQGWVVTIIDGDGYQLTSPFFPNGQRPIFYTNGTLLNTPAVGDIDNDGQLELIAANSYLYGWDLPLSSLEADWPVWKMNKERTPTLPMPARLSLPFGELIVFKDSNTPGPLITHIEIENLGDYPMDWDTSSPPGVSFTPRSGVLEARDSVTIRIQVDTSGFQMGYNSITGMEFTATADGQSVPGSPAEFSMLIFYGNVSRNLLPVTHN